MQIVNIKLRKKVSVVTYKIIFIIKLFVDAYSFKNTNT